MQHCTEKLVAAAQTLFPPSARVEGCVIGEAPEPSRPEAAVLKNAVASRRAEFAAGRYAARKAMHHIGLPAVPLPVGPMRAPVWPAEAVGSISHCGGVALAVVASTQRFQALGLDLELQAPLPPDILDDVTLASERAWIGQQPDPLIAARLIFSAKEAAYKCQFASSQALLGFQALEIRVISKGYELSATFTEPVPPFAVGDEFVGRFVGAQGFWITGFAMPAQKVAG